MHPKISIKVRTKSSDVKVPEYKTIGASGADVHAHLSEKMILKAGKSALVPTGLFFEIPFGFEIQVRPRSGLALKNGIMVTNSPGTIDADYRGELQIILFNSSSQDFEINPHDRIAQIVICPVIQGEFVQGELSDTQRGIGGFGSTGVVSTSTT